MKPLRIRVITLKKSLNGKIKTDWDRTMVGTDLVCTILAGLILLT